MTNDEVMLKKKKMGSNIDENVELFQVSQKAVIYDPEEKKYLLARYADSDAYCPGLWGFIGGRIDKGESAEGALQREILEETGEIDFRVEGVVGIDTNSQWDVRCRVGYLVLYKGGEIELSPEHSEYVWETAEEILHNKQYEEGTRFFIRKSEEYLSQVNALDNWKRAVAEFENYKKSKMNLERDMAGRAVEDFAYRLLPVVDNFHMSTDHIPEDQKASGWVQGIMYIQKQLEQVLQEMDIEEIVVKEGDVFDPSLHEAVAQTSNKQQATSNKQEGKNEGDRRGESEYSPEPEERRGDGLSSPETIKKVLMKGYKRGERVVRPARVIIQ